MLSSTKMKEASCLALFSITYHEERAVNCLKKDFFFHWRKRIESAGQVENIIYCALKDLRNLYVLIVPEIFVDRCPRNFSGPLFQKFLWILVWEISADESLSQKFLRLTRCLRNFCGWVVVKEISVAHTNCIFWVAFLLMFSRLLRPHASNKYL